jgi:hypothetical protein
MNNPSESRPPASLADVADIQTPAAGAAASARSRRGRVLRDTAVGDGLVFVDGDTYPFQLERLWRSEIAPRVNMAVDVEFGPDARIQSIRAVPGAQLFGDQTAHALDAAQSAARKMAAELNQRGAPALQQAIRRVGGPKLIAVCALALGWYSMHFLIINLGTLGKLSLTFHDVLKILNSDILNGDFTAILMAPSQNPLAAQAAGMYGFAAFTAAVIPLITPFLKDRRFQLADAAPLLVLGVVAAVACSQITSAIHGAQSALGELGAGGAAQTQQFGQQIRQGIASAVSVGLGTYASIIASIYLAASGYLRFRRGERRPVV